MKSSPVEKNPRSPTYTGINPVFPVTVLCFERHEDGVRWLVAECRPERLPGNIRAGVSRAQAEVTAVVALSVKSRAEVLHPKFLASSCCNLFTVYRCKLAPSPEHGVKS